MENWDTPLNKLYTYRDLRANVLATLDKTISIHNTNFPGNTSLVGIEVEVENIHKTVACQNWMSKPDGSLRVYGVEYISSPIIATTAKYHLKSLRDVLYSANSPDFSERTSIHVHVNIRNCSLRQIYKLTLLYIIFERVFYLFCGEARKSSNFCVPINDSSTYFDLIEVWKQLIKYEDLGPCVSGLAETSKYNGVNFNHIVSLGTIEFRQMYGNLDLDVLETWISWICALKETAMYNDEVINTLMNSSMSNESIDLIIKSIFKVNSEYIIKNSKSVLSGIISAQHFNSRAHSYNETAPALKLKLISFPLLLKLYEKDEKFFLDMDKRSRKPINIPDIFSKLLEEHEITSCVPTTIEQYVVYTSLYNGFHVAIKNPTSGEYTVLKRGAYEKLPFKVVYQGMNEPCAE